MREVPSPFADLVEAGIVQRRQASVYLKSLSDIGILEEQKGGRDKLFIGLPDILYQRE